MSQYPVDELAREIGRFVFFLLAVAGWTYLLLCLSLEYGG
jgi:hypothetical protein